MLQSEKDFFTFLWLHSNLLALFAVMQFSQLRFSASFCGNWQGPGSHGYRVGILLVSAVCYCGLVVWELLRSWLSSWRDYISDFLVHFCEDCFLLFQNYVWVFFAFFIGVPKADLIDCL
ncbi:hypothetical protein L195_g036376 [Trifolium pratense]|uniref:Uncharacterized protein n=1 Tax=Trifolium pratense TaxID=57577 RepID=A0A2K3L5W6_TRIPR|nr:hypothetical protein L195_g029837 [Trifolium pratense]PNX80377.1 hypothetical protein L195_g036376 [Trifolium pratense]